ncbi:DUF234 domain-containing protein [Sulfurospirillum arcachonense]|uniref:DUF234 domain-containing protein n=1 Tax=Sulfurospirillum arcachonense TaxID=57666 RepID=UPI00046A5403|nr:DUF234 domain-containing protein [Sulfurospirillum arcachonense]
MQDNAFKKFHDKFIHLNIEETIEFYSIFNGHPFLNFLNLDYDLSTCIQQNIIDKIDELKPYFNYDENLAFQEDLESILIRLAIGDRKSYTVYKKENISQVRGRALYKSLFEKNIIKKERSREKPLREFKGQLIKKSLRHYEIQDKIYFKDNFTRFWFTFIAPFLKKALHVNKEELLQHIISNIEQYISLTFEELSNQLIINKYKKENIITYGSYWQKNIEIDLLIEIKNGTIIAGESKWKNHRMCKNILSSLKRKCEKIELEVSHFVLCSKSGFSKELKAMNNNTILLFELKDFEELY